MTLIGAVVCAMAFLPNAIVFIGLGLALGFAMVELLSPVVGLQLYVCPAIGAEPICATFWVQPIVALFPALK